MTEEWDSHYEVAALPDKDQDVSKSLQFFLLIRFARVHALSSLRGSVFPNPSFFQIQMRESGNGQFLS